MTELEKQIHKTIANELYNRGYGSQRFGSVTAANDWLALLIVAVTLIFLWK